MNTMEQEEEPMYLSSFNLENLEGEIKNIDEYKGTPLIINFLGHLVLAMQKRNASVKFYTHR